MRGVGIQQMFLVGFAVARLPGPDGRPVWSAPCPLRITAAHLGVGVGAAPLETFTFIGMLSLLISGVQLLSCMALLGGRHAGASLVLERELRNIS